MRASRRKIGRAVQEVLESRRLMASINVTDFGATPDDGRDDRQAVINAINSSRNGDTIVFSGGTFNFSDSINVPGNRTYKGIDGATLKGHSPSQGELIKMQSHNVTFTGLTLDGGGIFMDNPGSGRNSNVVIENNTIKINTTGQHRSGITFTSGLSHSRISNNYFTGYNGQFGIYGYNYDNLTINNNEFVNINAGMHIDAFGNCNNLLVAQNFLSGIRGMGLEFQTTGSATPGATNLVFQDNWFERPALSNEGWRNWNSFAYSLPLDKARNVTIRRNVLIAPERPPGDKGIRIGFEVGGDNTLVEDNYVVGTNHVLAANDGMGSQSVTAKNNKFMNYLQGPSITFPTPIRTLSLSNNGPNVQLSDVMEERIANSDKPGRTKELDPGDQGEEPVEEVPPSNNPDPDPVVKPDKNSTFLSDLSWEFARNDWGPVERDRYNGGDEENDGGRLSLDGKKYEKGLGVAADSTVAYKLNGKYSKFNVDIGLDDYADERGSVTFQIWIDGRKVYDSGLMTSETEAKQLSIKLNGAKWLRLVTTDGGNGGKSDHANWANARLTPKAD